LYEVLVIIIRGVRLSVLLNRSVQYPQFPLHIKQLVKYMLTVLLLLSGFDILSEPSRIQGIRFWQSPDKTRVVFDMSASPKHQLIILQNPHRVVIDIEQGGLDLDLSKVNINSTLIEQIRTSRSKENGKLRVVLDLKRSVIPKSFTLKPIQNVGNRLVLDLKDPQQKVIADRGVTRAADLKKHNIFVVIDAGHGGEDPGASGSRGTKEKAITLSIAQKLAAIINQQKGMRAELSRKGDYYLSLMKRSEMARNKGADLFISIHADAFRSRKVRGSSVWVLSDKGANSEVGLWLEKRENDADLLGGVESVALNKYEPEVAEVLLKIQTERSVRLSRGIANNIIGELGTIMVLHNKKPREAGFVVLKNPAVPSILIETGFISNSNDEKNLRSKKFQDKLAGSILKGIHTYFRTNTPSGVKMASLSNSSKSATNNKTIHRIQRGDTLSGIANLYGVSLSTLRRTNRLKSDKLLVGKRLVIPGKS